MLLAAGADPQSRDVAGAKPMHFAARCGNVETINTLLAAGARPSSKVRSASAPLWLAGKFAGTGRQRRCSRRLVDSHVLAAP